MARPRHIRLTREGAYYTVVFLAVLVGAVSRQLNLLMLLGCVLGGPLLFSLIYGRLALRGLAIERSLPEYLHAGERLRVDVTLTNRKRWLGAWAVRVEDTVRRADAAEQATGSVFFPHVASGDKRQARYEGLLARRGHYRFGPLRILTRFPLGLVRHSLVVCDEKELLVRPRLGTLQSGLLKMIREHESGSQQMSRRGLLEADFFGLREWRPGDSRRWIHWRTSARRGGIVVRQFEQRRSQNMAVLVDLWQPADPTDEDLARVETAVSLVATLIAEACRRSGARLSLDVAAQDPLARSGAGSLVFLREQLESLALVEAHHDGALPPALGHALALVVGATPTFIVTTRPLDWEALRESAAARGSSLEGRNLQVIDVGGRELSRYFHP